MNGIFARDDFKIDIYYLIPDDIVQSFYTWHDDFQLHFK